MASQLRGVLVRGWGSVRCVWWLLDCLGLSSRFGWEVQGLIYALGVGLLVVIRLCHGALAFRMTSITGYNRIWYKGYLDKSLRPSNNQNGKRRSSRDDSATLQSINFSLNLDSWLSPSSKLGRCNSGATMVRPRAKPGSSSTLTI
jgi:hypothetical protein